MSCFSFEKHARKVAQSFVKNEKLRRENSDYDWLIDVIRLKPTIVPNLGFFGDAENDFADVVLTSGEGAHLRPHFDAAKPGFECLSPISYLYLLDGASDCFKVGTCIFCVDFQESSLFMTKFFSRSRVTFARFEFCIQRLNLRGRCFLRADLSG